MTARLPSVSTARSPSEFALTWLPPEMLMPSSAQIAASSIELASTLPPPLMVRSLPAAMP